MESRLRYTSNEELSVNYERAYIGLTKQSGTLFTWQGVCGRVIGIGCKPDWMTLKPVYEDIAINCTIYWTSEKHMKDMPDVDFCRPKQMPEPDCTECLSQIAELLALVVREKKQGPVRDPS